MNPFGSWQQSAARILYLINWGMVWLNIWAAIMCVASWGAGR